MTTRSKGIVPRSLEDAPALIERALPVQRLSAEAFKEQMAVHGKTLTALGSYWKGRKPLILNKACVLGCLLPATDEPAADLEIFELLMGMDDASFEKRGLRADQLALPYRERVDAARRPEERPDVHDHIWPRVNAHLGTTAGSIPELVEQLGVMRFGHRPRVGDTFAGSGQIPFEAARLGCDVYASDLNPIACMLTWGSFNIVGGTAASRAALVSAQAALVRDVQREIDLLDVETDGRGWRAKVYLYCLEVTCPETGWRVPMLPSLIISKGYRVVAKLVPDPKAMRYGIEVVTGATDEEMTAAERGTVRSEGRGQDPYLCHTVAEREYRTRVSTLRGDYRLADGTTGNRLRMWEKGDFMPRPEDLFQERLYAVQWMRPKAKGRGDDYAFRSVTAADLEREKRVEDYVARHLADWQAAGLVPEMRIAPGEKTDEPIRTRGWTHWHHLFNPRQLLVAGLANNRSETGLRFGLSQVLNNNCRLSRWNSGGGGGGLTAGVFDNMALNPLFNYGCRGSGYAASFFAQTFKHFPLPAGRTWSVKSAPADQANDPCDLFITDPPYGDAVKYEEILEFFIAWLRKHPPPEFSHWTWDSRRPLAIKGEDDAFRAKMVAAYRRMADLMPANGLQVIMFTHQSGTIWGDMANIVWASGLQVTAAWYVVTETESALRDGSHVKGTVLLVLRKRQGALRTTQDDLAWELQDEVKAQVETLVGLNQRTLALHRDENLFADADLQMAGYAAALRVLTRYTYIDGMEMAAEAVRPRLRGDGTFVDTLIDFAVSTANSTLVPEGLVARLWDRLSPIERFYLKMLELEGKGHRALDNYQNFAKAFKVAEFRPIMAEMRANGARLLGAVELGRAEMGDTSAFGHTWLRAILFGLSELVADLDGDLVLSHLAGNVANFYDAGTRDSLVQLTDFLASKTAVLRPKEAAAARVLGELLRHQRV